MPTLRENFPQFLKTNLLFLAVFLLCRDVSSGCRFVRREKEIAESRYEVAQGESLRHRLRVEHQERELKELQDSLNAERERMQVRLERKRKRERGWE